MGDSKNNGVRERSHRLLSAKNRMANDPESDHAGETAVGMADVLAMAKEAEAEAAAAEAVAEAARARARAVRLRRQAQEAETKRQEPVGEADQTHGETSAEPVSNEPQGSGSAAQPDEAAIDEVDSDEARESPATEPARPRRRWLRRPSQSAIAAVLAIVLISGFLGASGYMAWQDRNVMAERQRAAEFAAAARQGVVNLTSLDFNKAQEGVQRILDGSTGAFKDDFQARSADFINVVQQSKVVTQGTVHATAVESMTADSAEVLVAATSQVTNSAGAKNDPRSWRLSVTVSRDGGQLKIS